jgi:hypothetical protein
MELSGKEGLFLWLKAAGRTADFLAFDAQETADAIRDAEAP